MSAVINNNVILSINIKNLDTVNRKSITDYLYDFTKNYISILTSKPIDNMT